MDTTRRTGRIEVVTHGGIVLAAGASSRMGTPKALLKITDQQPLAVVQASLLRQAGCSAVTIVLGADYDLIVQELNGELVTRNPLWPKGRLTSIQAGLRALPDFDGYLILPVDTVGIRPQTLACILAFADRNRPPAIRPIYNQMEGKVLWISSDTARELLAMPAEDRRLDDWIRQRAQCLALDDPALIRNVNTPADLAALGMRNCDEMVGE